MSLQSVASSRSAMTLKAKQSGCLRVVLSTVHRGPDSYSDQEIALLEDLSESLTGAQDLAGAVAAGNAPTTEFRGALRDIRHLQEECVKHGMATEVAAIATQWPIPQSMLAYEGARNPARSNGSSSVASGVPATQTAWRTIVRARELLSVR